MYTEYKFLRNKNDAPQILARRRTILSNAIFFYFNKQFNSFHVVLKLLAITSSQTSPHPSLPDLCIMNRLLFGYLQMYPVFDVLLLMRITFHALLTTCGYFFLGCFKNFIIRRDSPRKVKSIFFLTN